MINSIDEAIKHCEEVAEKLDKQVKPYQCEAINKKLYKVNKKEWDDCLECASEHRQLAEWLRELKVKRQIITNVKEQCKVWKRNDFQNRDYGIGFISALGNIEGLIAYTEEQLEVNADE